MAVDVRTQPSFRAGIPHVLFEPARLLVSETSSWDLMPYDVSRAGQRFLMNMTLGEPRSRPISIVLDWTAELEGRQTILAIEGDVSERWWWPLGRGRAEAEVLESRLDREMVVDVGHDVKQARTPRARLESWPRA